MNQKHRILHVIDSLGNGGGAENQLLVNLTALNKERFKNHVCYLRDYRLTLEEKVSDLGIPNFCLGIGGKKDWIPGAFRLRRYIREKRINLVHTSLSESEIIGGLAGRLSGVPVVCSLVNVFDVSARLQEKRNPGWLKLYFAHFLKKLVYKCFFSHFIAISHYVQGFAIERTKLSANKITVIPRCVYKAWMDPVSQLCQDKIKSAYNLEENYPILLNVARLNPQKGQKYLLEAIPEVVGQYPRSKLLIVGQGILRNDIEKQIQDLGLEHYVTLLGKIEKSKVKGLLSVANIFVFPSLWEGFGVALLEAASLGKPCIACNQGPVTEIIEHEKSGLIVRPRDSEALAAAILRLSMDKEEAKSFGERAREKVLAEYQIEHNIRKIENVYLSLLET